MTTQLSNFSIASSIVSDFLAEKISHLAPERDMLITYRDGLFEAMDNQNIDCTKFHEELSNVVDQIAPIQSDLQVLKRQKISIEHGLRLRH
ncbi:hypothetical protein BDV26DRAFT_255870 [Aspergillus bertholletiae]|uniref:Uncharacterized protein n=1 Tax=Aspergillus bertholletiae TaxID=1226010 RepID=A0A5N7BHA8_9EURO|nr:hypothetical protein BDV26DRAFT_255870 [Aspergillus bertholletiae]